MRRFNWKKVGLLYIVFVLMIGSILLYIMRDAVWQFTPTFLIKDPIELLLVVALAFFLALIPTALLSLWITR